MLQTKQICAGCDAQFDGSPSLERSKTTKNGDPVTPELCWVCRRSYIWVQREYNFERARFAQFEKHWVE